MRSLSRASGQVSSPARHLLIARIQRIDQSSTVPSNHVKSRRFSAQTTYPKSEDHHVPATEKKLAVCPRDTPFPSIPNRLRVRSNW
jgi:hypothetical protein